MKKQITLVVSLAFLITCSIEVGWNLRMLLEQEPDSVLYIETSEEGATSTTQEDLLNFDFSLEEMPNAGS